MIAITQPLISVVLLVVRILSLIAMYQADAKQLKFINLHNSYHNRIG